MRFGFGPRIRHPFFPRLIPTPAREAKAANTVLCGSLAELLRAGDLGAQAVRAVFVTVPESQPIPSDTDRDTLWEMFQVPAYVLVLDGRGRVVAHECEAQGLHVAPSHIADGEEGEICGCGRAGRKFCIAGPESQSAPVLSLE